MTRRAEAASATRRAEAANVARRAEAANVTGKAGQEHKAQAAWAADCAERVLHYFEDAFPNDDRPRQAIEAARAWARGEIRVGEARAAALAAHAAARDAAAGNHSSACAAARAAGHAAATAHVASHARVVTFYVKKAKSHTTSEKPGAVAPRPHP